MSGPHILEPRSLQHLDARMNAQVQMHLQVLMHRSLIAANLFPGLLAALHPSPASPEVLLSLFPQVAELSIRAAEQILEKGEIIRLKDQDQG